MASRDLRLKLANFLCLRAKIHNPLRIRQLCQIVRSTWRWRTKKLAAGAGRALTASVAAAGAGIGIALAGAIPLVKMGSDLEEMQSKFDAVFKEEAGAAEEFAAGLAKGAGRSKIELKGFMSGLQDLFVPMGFARDSARQLSQTVTSLGVDLASFNNMSDDEAIEKLNAGLTGSHEVLKSFGVFINDNTLSLKLQEMGLAKNAQSATEQAKAMARLQIILESTSDAQGDAVRTSGSFANQWKALKGTLFDTASEIGASLLPAMTEIVGVLRSLMEFGFRTGDTFSGMGTTIGGVVSSILGWFKELAFVALNYDLTVRTLGLTLAETFLNMQGRVKTFADNAVTLFQWVGDNWRDIFNTAFDAITTALINLGENIKTLFTAAMDAIASGSMKPLTDALQNEMKGALEGMVSTVSSMPEFKQFVPTDALADDWKKLDKDCEERAAEWEKIMKKNSPKLGDAATGGVKDAAKELQGTVNDVLGKLKESGPTEIKKNKSKKSSGGETVGLQAAFDKLQKSALSGKDDMQKKQLTSLKDIAKAAKETNTLIKKGGNSTITAVLA